jgi:hypothetical protein
VNSRKKASQREDSAWTRSSGRRAVSASSKENILNARCDTQKEGVKTSFAVNMDSVQQSQPVSREELASRLEKGLSEESFRPLQSLEFNELGSPLYGKTPGGTTLFKDKKYSAIYTFSNRESAQKAYEEYQQSAQCKQLNDFLLTVKVQQVTVTDEQQAIVAREKKKLNHKRKVSQKAVMDGESAEEHVIKHSVAIKNVRFEWAHLLAHALVGSVGQQQDNLVATTAYANTDMIFAEAELAIFSSKYPDGFDVEVTAYVLSGTHIAEKIEYKIKIPGCEQTYEFDGQSPVQPHISFKNYFRALANALTKESSVASPYVASRTRMVNPDTNLFSKAEQRKGTQIAAGSDDDTELDKVKRNTLG